MVSTTLQLLRTELCKVPFKRHSTAAGVYDFGTIRVQLRMQSHELVVKALPNGEYQNFHEFVATFVVFLGARWAWGVVENLVVD